MKSFLGHLVSVAEAVFTSLYIMLLVLILFLLIVIASLALGLDDSLPLNRASDAAGIILGAATVTALVAAGVFAIFKLRLFRAFEPNITVSQEISHSPMSDSYVHISVIANLYNSSKVQIGVREGFFRLQQVSPLSDEEVEELYAEVFTDREYRDIQWPVLDEVPRSWGNLELVVEPGESHHESASFIISNEVNSVLVHTYFYDVRHSSSSLTPQGWGTYTAYNVN